MCVAETREKVRYRDLGRLGTGGMATVTLAEDLLLRRRVALKRVHSAGDPRELSRLRREALVGASLNHRNLVAVYDVQEAEDGDLVIVMEYVEGETLRQAIRRRGAFPPDEALSILRGLGDALDALHDRGIIHRDVKPENILLGSETVKLADLGIARAPEHTQTTAGGAIPGTFSYMAPEQLEGREQGPAIDVYALAAVAFEMLCGSKARRESNPVALAHAIATHPPPDLREEWPQAPAEAAALLTTAMSADPLGRPASAGVLVERLGNALTSRSRRTPSAHAAPLRPRLPPPPVREPGRGAPRASRAPRAAAAQASKPVRRTPSPPPRSVSRGEARARRPAGAPPGRTRPCAQTELAPRDPPRRRLGPSGRARTPRGPRRLPRVERAGARAIDLRIEGIAPQGGLIARPRFAQLEPGHPRRHLTGRQRR